MNQPAQTAGQPGSAAAGDPMPEPPQAPLPGDCCHSGCAFCVEDMYQDELARYQAALKAWRQRHPG